MYLLEFSVLEEEGVGGGAVPVLHSHNYHALAGQVIADLGRDNFEIAGYFRLVFKRPSKIFKSLTIPYIFTYLNHRFASRKYWHGNNRLRRGVGK